MKLAYIEYICTFSYLMHAMIFVGIGSMWLAEMIVEMIDYSRGDYKKPW